MKIFWTAALTATLGFAQPGAGFSHFCHPMTQEVFRIYTPDGTVTERNMATTNPFDMPAAHIYKVTGGKLHKIEAVGVSVPYNSPTGWE